MRTHSGCAKVRHTTEIAVFDSGDLDRALAGRMEGTTCNTIDAILDGDWRVSVGFVGGCWVAFQVKACWWHVGAFEDYLVCSCTCKLVLVACEVVMKLMKITKPERLIDHSHHH